MSKLLSSLSEREREELVISITSDVTNLVILESEYDELISLINQALDKGEEGALILEFLLGVPSLGEYLDQEIAKLQEYIEEDQNEETMEETD